MLEKTNLLYEFIITPTGQGVVISALFYCVLIIYSIRDAITKNTKPLSRFISNKHLVIAVSLIPILMVIANGLFSLNITAFIMDVLPIMIVLMTPLAIIHLAVWFYSLDWSIPKQHRVNASYDDDFEDTSAIEREQERNEEYEADAIFEYEYYSGFYN